MSSIHMKFVFSLLVIATLLTGCGIFKHEPTTTPLVSFTINTTPVSPDAFQRTECSMENPEVPEDRRVEIQCGTLTVPEDRLKTGSPNIQIAVAIVKSSNPDKKPDPVLVLVGNAGFGTDFAYGLSFILPGVLDNRDMIIVDNRGTGHSIPSIKCPEFDNLLTGANMNMTVQETNDQMVEASTSCASSVIASGVDLNNYSTAAMAADLADLRQALGISDWNIYSLFNGSRLALTLMRDYPQGIRSVVLDSPVPLQANPDVEYGANAFSVLDAFFQACTKDELCNTAYPNVKDTFYKLLDQLDTQPITVDVADPYSGDRYKVTLDSERFITYLLGLFTNEGNGTTLGEIPRMIYQLKDGKTEAASRLMGQGGANFPYTPMSMWLNCNEELSFMTQEQVSKANEAVGLHLQKYFDKMAEGSFLACKPWRAPGASMGDNLPVDSNIPALLMAGEYDWTQPPVWADLIAQNLRYSTVVKYPGSGMLAGLSPKWSECSRQMINTFLETPGTKPDVSCSMKPAKFTWITLP